MKNFIKEIIIILLLTLAIILILGVILYEYVPANKIIPEKVSYTTPEEVKAELATEVDESDEELYIDYHSDATQLYNYQKIQEYVAGKKNPFSSLDAEDTSSETTNDGTQSNTSGSTGTTSTTTDSTDEQAGYLPNKGTK